MSDDDLAALAALLRGAAGPGAEFLARTILESEWLREHDARVRHETVSTVLKAIPDFPYEGVTRD